MSVGSEPPPEMIPGEKSEKDEGTSEKDKDEEEDFLDPGRELVMEYERDRNNTLIFKLVLATASNLKWDHFTGQSIKRK